jgi:hypothetical protein
MQNRSSLLYQGSHCGRDHQATLTSADTALRRGARGEVIFSPSDGLTNADLPECAAWMWVNGWQSGRTNRNDSGLFRRREKRRREMRDKKLRGENGLNHCPAPSQPVYSLTCPRPQEQVARFGARPLCKPCILTLPGVRILRT